MSSSCSGAQERLPATSLEHHGLRNYRKEKVKPLSVPFDGSYLVALKNSILQPKSARTSGFTDP